MGTQLIATGVIVALAGGYLAWMMGRSFINKNKSSCGNGCGKCGATANVEENTKRIRLV